MSQLKTNFVVCIDNTDYPVALEIRKIYKVIPDKTAAKHQLIRVIDESGEDYPYPAGCFVPIDLPDKVAQALHLAA